MERSEAVALSCRSCGSRSVLLVSEVTIKSHGSRILVKFGLRDRAQLVVDAYESGLVRQKVE